MCVRLLSPRNSCTLSHLLNGPSVCLVTNFLLGSFSATSKRISAWRPIYSPLTFISEPGSFLEGVVDSDSLTTSLGHASLMLSGLCSIHILSLRARLCLFDILLVTW